MGIVDPQVIETEKIVSELKLIIELIKKNDNKMNEAIEFRVQDIYHDFWITQVPDKKLLGDFYFAVGLGYQLLKGEENKSKSLRYFQDAEGIVEGLKDFDKLFEVYNEIGIAYYTIKKFDLANLYYNKAFELAEINKLDDNKKSSILVNLATINQQNENYEIAISQLQQALQIFIDESIEEHPEESKNFLGIIYYNIATNFLYLFEFDKSLEYYRFGNQYVEYPIGLKKKIKNLISFILKDIEDYDKELIELIIKEVS